MLSYNHFDFGPLFSEKDKVRKEKREQEKHQSTFFRQMVYFLLFTILNLGSVISSIHHVYIDIKFRLTISTEITMMPMDMVKLVDTNGNLHSLTKFQVRIITH